MKIKFGILLVKHFNLRHKNLKTIASGMETKNSQWYEPGNENNIAWTDRQL